MKRFLGVVIGAALILLLSATAASAHPLGNFTVNTFTALRVQPSQVLIDHVTDRAEIPTQQLTFAGDPISQSSPPTVQQAWSIRDCKRIAADLTLVVDGRKLSVTVGSAALRFPPGAGGIPTSRLTCRLLSDRLTLRSGSTVRYQDHSDDDRVGWHEIIAVGDGATLRSSDVPAASVSRALTAYPKDLLSSPLATKVAKLVAAPGGAAAGDPLAGTDKPAGQEQRRGVDSLTAAFTDLVGRHQLSIGIGALAILLALILGAFHAFAPGHGKTVMAAYLVADRGSLRQVSLIGLSVTAAHTLGVLILGLLLSSFATFAPEKVYPWLGVASGLLLLSIGASLVRAAWQRRSLWAGPPAASDHLHLHDQPDEAKHEHEHEHDGHAHHHSEHRHPHEPVAHHHAHEHEHATSVAVSDRPVHQHDVAIAAEIELIGLAEERPIERIVHSHGGRMHSHAPINTDQPIRLRNVISMGLAGGLVPSPSALVVLVGAIALHRAWFGVILVIFYGAGMALTLVGIGLLLSRLRGRFMHRLKAGSKFGRAFTILPFGTASLICIIGAYLAIAGLLKV
ncbi:MAG: high-affinity nickel-transporter [Mycobacterium sp.]|nr:high-affinity nickel-transporter [Mycobacterium sp.]